MGENGADNHKNRSEWVENGVNMVNCVLKLVEGGWNGVRMGLNDIKMGDTHTEITQKGLKV